MSTTVDHVQAASVPNEISVSIVAARCRAFSEGRAVERQPHQKTTGVDRASASHSQPANCSGGTIAISASGAVRRTATSRRVARAAGRASGSAARPGGSAAW